MTIVTFDEQGNAHETKFKLPKLPEWGMAKAIGYKPKTTFWQDFSIADLYGPEAVLDTFKRAFREWCHDVEYIAEMSLVLNHKGFWYNSASEKKDNNGFLALMSELYFNLYEQLNEWAKDNYKDADAEYYFNVTD